VVHKVDMHKMDCK